jgi:hypothetical protein
MIKRDAVKVGNILLLAPYGIESEEYHLFLNSVYTGSKDHWDEWTTFNMTKGELEEVSITDANSINWTRVA